VSRPASLNLASLVAALPAVVAVAAFGVFVRNAVLLAAYPFDWDPGEGLVLDMALRLQQHGLPLLYPAGDVVPAPFTYGPLLPALLAVLARHDTLMATGRWLGFGFALSAAAAVYALVRARAPRGVAWGFAALSLAPASHTFWLVLVRADGPMIACWLWAAVLLLPPRLARGCDRLGWLRTVGGGLLLVLAVLAKPVAVIIGAPLVLAWWLVDGRSALRLNLLVLLLGGACFAWLQLATHGGFFRTLMFQTLPDRIAGQTAHLVRGSLIIYLGGVALTAVGAVVALRRRDGSLRDGAWLLWLAGPIIVPTLAKAGATFNYALPWAMGQAALAGRLFGPGWAKRPAETPAMVGHALGGLPAAIVALALMLGGFPLPTGEDRRTAESFYGFLAERGGPILAVHPDLAYFHAHQPVLLEMALFPDLYRHNLPGARALFDRLDRHEFRTLVENLDRWSLEAKGYAAVGGCQLAFHYGRNRFLLLVPAAEAASVRFSPLPGARCLARSQGQ
jgi:hypothetical protein